jgi:glucosamine-6-phosphate deaminase
VADFDDPELVKVVALDATSRQQQVNDGCFATLEAVPTQAITLTIPALLSGQRLFCVVPGLAKRAAVARALRGPVEPACPASILRRHPHCTLYLDVDSYDQR